MDFLAKINEEYGPKFEALNKRLEDAGERLEHARDSEDSDAVKSLTERTGEIETELRTLTSERDARVKDAELETMQGQIKSLTESLEKARVPDSKFFGLPSDNSAASQIYGENGEYSFYQDAYKAIKQGDHEAKARWAEASEGKAMTLSPDSAGGFLVPEQISEELIALRDQATVIRGRVPEVDVRSDTLRIAKVTSGLTADWVAELANKPEQDAVFEEVSVGVFTKAGLTAVSNQLLRDAVGNKAIDTFVAGDLAKRLAIVEERAVWNGSGTGQPLGILNTTGINSVTNTSPTDVFELLDDIADGITEIVTNFFGAPDWIVMHPRTWARIVKARESGTSANYIVGPPNNLIPRRANDPLPGFDQSPPVGSLFGVPVVATNTIPTNLGAGSNESAVIIGAFREALILNNQAVTLDVSEHVRFTTNQTMFRAEDRVGFTAERYPEAFSAVTGPGLAGG